MVVDNQKINNLGVDIRRFFTSVVEEVHQYHRCGWYSTCSQESTKATVLHETDYSLWSLSQISWRKVVCSLVLCYGPFLQLFDTMEH